MIIFSQFLVLQVFILILTNNSKEKNKIMAY